MDEACVRLALKKIANRGTVDCMTGSISAHRVATLVGPFDRSPAYAGLAEALVLLIGDGRIGFDTRLPSERELTDALGVSRTTVTRAYAALRDAGYAEARQGAGTFTRVPGGRARSHDRALLPRPGDGDAIDLNCAAALRASRASRRRTPRLRPSCRRTSAATGTSPPACPSSRRRSPRPTGLAACPPTLPRSWSPPAPCPPPRSWPRPSPAPAIGCWSRRPSTPTPPRRSGQRRPGHRLSRSIPTGGTSMRSAPPCARPRLDWPT